MKKTFITLLAIMCLAAVNVASAKTSTSNSTLASAIRLYKAKDYTQSYFVLKDVVQKDPSNSIAYYYLAMSSAQIGNKDEAIANYDKALSLSQNSQIQYYANKGKLCLQDPAKCNEPSTSESELDRFIRGGFGTGFSREARGKYEKNKIENMMREMNRNDSIVPSKFKEYKDFSSYATPTDEEIVAAIRVLQNAGLGNMVNGNTGVDMSLMTGYSNGNNNYEMLNMLLGNGSNVDPRLIQSMLSTQMTAGF